MKIAEVKVNGTTCDVTRLVPISKGLVGATVSIEYTNAVWDGLQKTVVFRSSVTKDVLVTGSEVVIPAEVVSRAGVNLYMGVYGVDATNNVVIPTIWAELGLVHGAAAPSGDTSIGPTLPVWAQIQGMIGNLDDLDTDAKSSLVAAVNEALTKGGGEIDPAEVQKIVEDYLAKNPPGAGPDGVTPTIGDNGNWYLGSTDTGKPSRGENGVTPDIQIGTVTTLPADSDATASMGGTAENPLLNLGIPKGADGTGSGQIRKLGSLTLEEPVSTVEISIPGGANEVWVHFYNVYDAEISAKLGILCVNGKSVILGQNLPLDSINQQIAMHLLILTDGIGYASVSSGSQSTNSRVAVGFAPCGWGAAYNGDFGDTISRVAFSQSDPSKSFAPGCMMDVWGR